MKFSNTIYSLVAKGVKFWIENNKLKLSIPKDSIINTYEKTFLIKNKRKIFNLARVNAIFSKNEFPEIFSFSSKNVELSNGQKSIYFVDKFSGGTSAYNIPILFEVSPKVNLRKLLNDLEDLEKIHILLRSKIYIDSNSNIFLESHIENQVTLIKKEVKNFDELCSNIHSDINYNFDFRKDLLFRKTIYLCVETKKYYLNLVFHHIIFDGWSADIILRDLSSLYNGTRSFYDIYTENRKTYDDYVVWHDWYKTTSSFTKQLEYWQKALDSYQETSLLENNRRPSNLDFNGKDIFFKIETQVSQQLKLVSSELCVSNFSLLLSAYFLLISVFAKQNDIIVGVPFANRGKQDFYNTIGMFVNMLPIRVNIDHTNSISDFIKYVNEKVREAQNNLDVPFDIIVDNFSNSLDRRKNPIFQTMFVVQKFGDLSLDEDNILISNDKLNKLFTNARFDISVFLDDTNDRIDGKFNYATSVYDQKSITSMQECYVLILNQISQINLSLPISKIRYEDESKFVESIGSQKFNKLSLTSTIHGLFELQASENPQNIAVKYKGESFSYHCINTKANQLARFLGKSNSSNVIAIMMDVSEMTLISILAILKLGKTYICIDPSNPINRLKYIIDDTQASTLITDIPPTSISSSIPKNTKFKVNILNIQTIAEKLTLENSDNLYLDIQPTSLANIFYTSGTTGWPKGILIEHSMFLQSVISIKELYFYETQKLKTCSISSPSFDIFGLEYGLTILFGGTLKLLDKTFSRLDCSDIDFFQSTPSVIKIKLSNLFNCSETILFIGGEVLESSLLKKLVKKFKLVVNVYGPTETTIWSTSKEYSKENLELEYLCSNIGKPLQGKQALILNDYLKPLPRYAKGNLFFAGGCLSRGYLNLDEQNKKVFVNFPFREETNAVLKSITRLYNTGDLVRRREDNDLEYISRDDSQVKVNGNRIELSEIEYWICKGKHIKNAVVLKKIVEDSEYLVGYLECSEEIDIDALKKSLAINLPDHYIPNFILVLEKFPTNKNGKIDLKSLPMPKVDKVTSKNHIENDLTLSLNKILVEILPRLSKNSSLGVNQNFFEFGLNSLLAIKLVNIINSEFSVSLSIKDIFKNNTISKLTSIITNPKDTRFVEILTHLEKNNTVYPLSFAQERLLFMEKLYEGCDFNNLPIIFKVNNSLNTTSFSNSILYLINFHQILKTLITVDENKLDYVQKILDSVDQSRLIKTKIVKKEKQIRKIISEEMHHVFDLNNEIPIRITFIYNKNSGYLVINFHHIAFDGMSTEVFFRDLCIIYEHHLYKTNIPIKNILKGTLQYSHFSQWQRKVFTNNYLQSKSKFWKKKLLDCKGNLCDFMRDHLNSDLDFRGDEIFLTLDQKLSSRLRKYAAKNCVTLLSLMVSVYFITLSKFSNQRDIVIGVPYSGRTQIDLENSIGFFVNTLPIRELVDPDLSCNDFIKQISRQIIETHLYQDFPYERIVRDFSVRDAHNRNPIFQFLFSVQSFGKNFFSTHQEYRLTRDIEPLESKFKYKVARYDITTIIDDYNPEINVLMNYATAFYNEVKINNFISLYKDHLKEVVGEKNKYIYELL